MSDMTKERKKILMYMHAGSGNHGCEAIVRSLLGIFDTDVTLLTHNAEEDYRYKLNDNCNVVPARNVDEHFFRHAWFYLLKKLFHKGEPRMAYRYKDAGDFSNYDLAISIGGDNYCYEDTLYDLRTANSMFTARGVRTALVGCSIEPELLKRPEMIEDMRKYSFIAARESITYEALVSAFSQDGYDTGNAAEMNSPIIKLIPDPAFSLRPSKCALPEGFVPRKTIGINVSPMILGYEREDAPGITINNYRKLIGKILETTDDVIALIPHVVMPLSDDRKPLKQLYDEFADTGRVILVEDHPAEEIKYIISECRLLIAARTHATIAAYSTCVPTLVVGYSVKSRGIAMDLFGSVDGYVLPVQELKNDDDLANAYLLLEKTSMLQKAELERIMPDYIERAFELREYC